MRDLPKPMKKRPTRYSIARKAPTTCFFDGDSGRIYITSAEGFLEVLHEEDPNHYVPVVKIFTGPMGKNLALDKSHNRLYVAVPPYGNVQAKILVYSVQ